MHAIKNLICVALTFILANCMASLPKEMPSGPKTYKNKVELRIMGSRRTYLVHVPPITAPHEALPLIVFHGLADDAIPAQGGISPKRGGDQSFLSVKDATDFWVHNNGCTSKPIVSNSHQQHVRIQTWKACRRDADVVLYLMKNWEHVWPGRHYTADLSNDHPLKDFDAAAIIWDFFNSHPKIP